MTSIRQLYATISRHYNVTMMMMRMWTRMMSALTCRRMAPKCTTTHALQHKQAHDSHQKARIGTRSKAGGGKSKNSTTTTTMSRTWVRPHVTRLLGKMQLKWNGTKTTTTTPTNAVTIQTSQTIENMLHIVMVTRHDNSMAQVPMGLIAIAPPKTLVQIHTFVNPIGHHPIANAYLIVRHRLVFRLQSFHR